MTTDKEKALSYAAMLNGIAWIAYDRGMEAAQSGKDFDMGLSMAYYDILTNMVDDANLYGIPLEDLGMDKMNPDKDLLKPQS